MKRLFAKHTHRKNRQLWNTLAKKESTIRHLTAAMVMILKNKGLILVDGLKNTYQKQSKSRSAVKMIITVMGKRMIGMTNIIEDAAIQSKMKLCSFDVSTAIINSSQQNRLTFTDIYLGNNNGGYGSVYNYPPFKMGSHLGFLLRQNGTFS